MTTPRQIFVNDDMVCLGYGYWVDRYWAVAIGLIDLGLWLLG